MNWELAADIATVLTSVSLLFAVVQLIKEMQQQNVEAFFYLHEYLSQEQFSSARKRVRTKLYEKPYSEWTDEDKDKANQVCASYDQAGILIQGGIIKTKTKESFLSSSWGRSIVDQYESLSSYLDDKQTPSLTGREFFKHFTWLYQEAQRFQEGLKDGDD